MSSTSKDGFLALSGSLLGLSAIATGLRLYARKRYHLRILWDDWFAAGAFVSFIGAAICAFLLVRFKDLGYSSKEFTAAQLIKMGKLSNELQISLDVFSTTTVACTKISAIFFYRRMFCTAGPRQLFDAVTKISIVVVLLWLVVFQFLTGFQCGTHFPALWDGEYEKYCTFTFPLLEGLAISDLLLEVWILLLPMPSIMQLQMSLAKKLSVIGIFLLAFVGLGASIARMVVLILIEAGGETYFLHHNQELAVTKYFYFTMLEAGMSLIAVNLPSLWVLVTSNRAKLIAERTRNLVATLSRRSDEDNDNATQAHSKGPPQKTSHSVGADAALDLVGTHTHYSAEAYAMGEVRNSWANPQKPDDESIYVDKVVDQWRDLRPQPEGNKFHAASIGRSMS